MKYVLLAATMMVAGLAHAEALNFLSCSNAQGTVLMNKSEVTINTVTLGGPQTIVLKMEDIIIKAKNRRIVESKTSSTDTICGIDRKVKKEQYTQKITVSKKDGSEIIQDDTPESSPKKITEIVLCEETNISAWPCKD
ncbi:hypothetical protein [Bdellovibrio sp. HCB337]|uniref:hypothetical protein n=1 Tax=Bdellovibrio sp. HCB337 TaxID=3394358 RepID=UPI0039A7145F